MNFILPYPLVRYYNPQLIEISIFTQTIRISTFFLKQFKITMSGRNHLQHQVLSQNSPCDTSVAFGNLNLGHIPPCLPPCFFGTSNRCNCPIGVTRHCRTNHHCCPRRFCRWYGSSQLDTWNCSSEWAHHQYLKTNKNITVTSHGHHFVSNHWQLDCFAPEGRGYPTRSLINNF